MGKPRRGMLDILADQLTEITGSRWRVVRHPWQPPRRRTVAYRYSAAVERTLEDGEVFRHHFWPHPVTYKQLQYNLAALCDLIHMGFVPVHRPLDPAALPAVLEGHWKSETGRDMAATYATMERERLCGGRMSDLEVAHDTAMIMRDDRDHEPRLHTARDRIRWLSVQLAIARGART